MRERRFTPFARRLAPWSLAGLILVGLFAPLIANDRPILADVGGRIVSPALAELPLVGRLFERPETQGIDWSSPGAEVRTILRPLIP